MPGMKKMQAMGNVQQMKKEMEMRRMKENINTLRQAQGQAKAKKLPLPAGTKPKMNKGLASPNKPKMKNY